ncbi:phage tail protein [Salmonella enterica subsp. enterica serovar Kottbus]|nr:phage tail protein [Salmonella enterica subsp. enterica serovar Kottbus]
MIIGFGNNVVSSLAADITASQTTIQVMPGAGAMFANLLTSDYANSSNPLKTYAKITLTDAKETVFEVCHLTAVNNDMLTVIRGQEGTTAKGWSLNDVIANFATRGSENQFVQIEELQSGHYVAGVAGGTENNLTLELPATYFVNGGVDWTLRTPLVVIPALNNTGASTLQLTMGGRVLGIFPLYKGNKTELSANDIIKDAPVLCVLDNTKTYFSVLNPLEIYLGSRYLQKDQNLADVPDKALARQSLLLGDSATRNVGTTQGTVAAGDDSRITGALQKSQNGADIPDKKQFIENVGLTGTVSQAAGAVQKTGDTMTGKLTLPQTSCFGVNTDNALGGSSIAIGDNDTGIKQNGDGVLDVIANGQLVARIQPGTLFVISAVQAGDGKKLTLSSANNSALNAGFNLWGDGGNRPTVIELGDDQGWHLYSQRNTNGDIQFCTVGQVVPGNWGNFDARYLASGGAYTKGESDARYVQNIQRGAPVSPGKIDEYGPAEAPAGCVLTNARHDPGTKYGVFTTYRPLQMWIGNGWRTING